MGNRVDDFLSKLAAQAPKAKENNFEQKNRSLEKIYLNFPEILVDIKHFRWIV